jgi:glutaredoxin
MTEQAPQHPQHPEHPEHPEQPPRVVLYSRPGCHLCDEARVVIERVCADLGERYAEVGIDDDPALRERFTDEVPVTFVDGRQHDFWRVDEQRLRAALGGDGRAR